jgi:signal transduction histidine kinase
MIQLISNFSKKNPFLVGIPWALFVCFIIFCGLTHMIMPYSFYHESVRIVLLAICCTISALTAVVFTFIFPILTKMTDRLELTEEGKLQQTHNRLVDVINCCQESIVILSHDWYIITANDCTRNFFGDNFMNVPFLSLVHDDDKSKVVQGFEDIIEKSMKKHARKSTLGSYPSEVDAVELGLSGTDASFEETETAFCKVMNQVCLEFRLKDENDGWSWIESTLMISGDGDGRSEVGDHTHDGVCAFPSRDQLSLMMMSRNINHKKREEALKKEEELSFLKELENIAKLKYITCCAHDLKTPLQSFKFAIDLLEGSGLQPDQLDILHQARVSALLLSMTISQTMDTSKVVMGERLIPRKTTIQLSEVVSRVAIVIESYGRQVPISFHLQTGINNYIVTDEEWLWQMLLNYLTNACKYTEQGAIDVDVMLWSGIPEAQKDKYVTSNLHTDRGSDFLLFRVIDTGIGILDQHASTLFNVFSQAQVGQSTGTGMGLYGVKIRAEGLEGDCGVINRVDQDGEQGSVFWFTIAYVADNSYLYSSSTTMDTIASSTDASVSIDNDCGQIGQDLASMKHYSHPAHLFKNVHMDGDKLHLLLTPEKEIDTHDTLTIESPISLPDITIAPVNPAVAVVNPAVAVRSPSISTYPFTAFVVDDVPMIRKLMKRTLKQLGFLRIELFENGSKALTAMKQEHVDFVFMDVQMPVMSGPEVSSPAFVYNLPISFDQFVNLI